MNSRRHNNRTRQWAALLTLAVVVIAGIEYLSQGIIRTSLRDAFSGVWSVTQGASAVIANSGALKTKAELAREVATLKEERDTFISLRLQDDVLRAENAALRGLLGLNEREENGFAARVLSRPSISPYSTFVISAGGGNGVTEGSIVFAAPDIAIGEVVEVGNETSLVSLYSSPGRKVQVRLGEDVVLSYVGRGGGNGMIEVPRGIPVSAGDSVFLPDSGFIMGLVGSVEASPEDALQKVLIAPPTNLPALSFVYVLPE